MAIANGLSPSEIVLRLIEEKTMTEVQTIPVAVSIMPAFVRTHCERLAQESGLSVAEFYDRTIKETGFFVFWDLPKPSSIRASLDCFVYYQTVANEIFSRAAQEKDESKRERLEETGYEIRHISERYLVPLLSV